MKRQIIYIGLIGAVLISTASLYIAMRLGALPWPTIFAVLASRALLKAWGIEEKEDINLAHTMMSTGAMIAGGLAFTLPALWLLGEGGTLSYLSLLGIVAAGVLLGQAIAPFVRTRSIGRYPFPIGQAAYDTLIASLLIGDEKKGASDEQGRIERDEFSSAKKEVSHEVLARPLFASMGVAGLFSLLRDWFHIVPAVFGGLFWASPMALGIGFIIGPLYTSVWFLGSIFAYALMPRLGWGDAIRVSAGIGLMVGCGIAMILQWFFEGMQKKEAYTSHATDTATSVSTGTTSASTTGGQVRASAVATAQTSSENADKNAYIGGQPLSPMQLSPVVPLMCVAAALGILFFLGLPLYVLAIVGVGALFMPFISGILTGRSGINPMEILGILVMLVVAGVGRFLQASFGLSIASSNLSPAAILICVACVTAISCGLGGDMLNDYHVGALLDVAPKKQWIAETMGAAISVLVLPAIFLFLIGRFGNPGSPELPVPQARMVATMVAGIPHLLAFSVAAVLAMIAFFFKLPILTLGLGVYLPLPISLTISFGGFIAWCVAHAGKLGSLRSRCRPQLLQKMSAAIASGAIAGEAAFGVIISILLMLFVS